MPVRSGLARTIERWLRSRHEARRESSERGDTLIEVLLALVVLGLAGLALLAGFATAITSSSEHRHLAALDSSYRVAANTAIADIQQQAQQFANQANDPFVCPNTFNPTFPNLSGQFQVTASAPQYWNTTTNSWQSTCIAGAAQQYTLTISSATNNFTTTETTVISDPAAPLAPNGNGAPVQLAWVQQPTGGSAFSPVSPQPEVAVEDSSGSIVTSDFSSVTLQLVSGPPGGAISNTCAGVESYGLVQFSDCTMNVAGSYTIRAVDSNPSVQATPTISFPVTPASAARIAFVSNSLSGPASSSATLGPITVQEQDAFGNPIPTPTALQVNLTSNSTGTSVFSKTSGGVAITSVTIPANSSTAPTFFYGDTKAGTPSITAAATGLASGSQSETITGATASQLAITSSPFSAAASNKATASFTVTLEDTFGNVTTKTSSTTVNLTSNSTGTHEFSATSGGANVTSVPLAANTSSVTAYYGDAKIGTPTISAAATGLTTATQQETISTGPTKLVLTGPTSGSASGTAALGPFTVTEETAAGALTTVGETVTLTSTSTGTYIFNATQGASTPTGSTTVTIPNGQSSATFYYGDSKVGTPTITAAANGLTSATQQETIASGPAAQLTFTNSAVSGTASTNATLGPLTVQEQDAFGNTTTSALTINLSSSSTGTSEFAATSGGGATTSITIAAGRSTASFFYGDTQAGTPTITGAATGLTSGTQTETINASAGTQLAITSTPFSGTANVVRDQRVHGDARRHLRQCDHQDEHHYDQPHLKLDGYTRVLRHFGRRECDQRPVAHQDFLGNVLLWRRGAGNPDDHRNLHRPDLGHTTRSHYGGSSGQVALYYCRCLG